jgi:catechol 2,3-dioxygenase-like lactoylglutathione lyase family enzyme
MILNHLNLTVTDVPASRRFFAAVDALHARLTAEGFAPDAPARSHAYTFYVKAPGGFVVEVLC